MEYKKIVKDIVNIINTAEKSDIGFTKICTYIDEKCPELKKEQRINDETLKKKLIKAFNTVGAKYWGGLEVREILTWLEKQGEKPQGKSALEAVREEKVESKFKIGDWIISHVNECVYQVVEVKRSIYVIRNIYNKEFSIGIESCERTSRLWELSDAKIGDVLFLKGDANHSNGIKYERICLFDNLDNAFFSLTKSSNYIEYAVDVSIDYPNNTIPATKEQRDILFKAMADAGYSFDFEKKELKKIE